MKGYFFGFNQSNFEPVVMLYDLESRPIRCIESIEFLKPQNRERFKQLDLSEYKDMRKPCLTKS